MVVRDPAIKLVRPYETLILSVAKLFATYKQSVYSMTEREFIGHVMKLSNGTLNPGDVKECFIKLKKQAGMER